jgi:hypothetical protein
MQDVEREEAARPARAPSGVTAAASTAT